MAEKEPYGVSLYAAQGGKARASALTEGQRREIARAAAEARWLKEGHAVPVRATYQGHLNIAAIKIPCYVLADGRRVLEEEFQSSLQPPKRKRKPARRWLAIFLSGLGSKGLQVSESIMRLNNVIRFVPPPGGGGRIAHGIEAAVLPEICNIVIKAQNQGLLRRDPQVKTFARHCRRLNRVLSEVSIIALIDKATGYDRVEPRDAQADASAPFVAKKLRRWVKTFPPEFFKTLFHLKGWTLSPASAVPPQVIGELVNNLVWRRLAPEVLKELRIADPREDKSRLRRYPYGSVAEEGGHPRLREHLAAVIALMKASISWDQFSVAIDRALPAHRKTI